MDAWKAWYFQIMEAFNNGLPRSYVQIVDYGIRSLWLELQLVAVGRMVPLLRMFERFVSL